MGRSKSLKAVKSPAPNRTLELPQSYRDEQNPTSGTHEVPQESVSERSTPESQQMFRPHQKDPSPSLTQAFDVHVRPYIDLIDNLRAYGLDKDVGLPAVAVIGDQSSGKSSTLEAISGIQLPRGSGIVTRCPLELRMKCDRGETPMWSSKISYTDKDGEDHSMKMDSPDLVEEAVRNAQDAMTEGEVGISDKLITLEVVSADVPDLTLIDLPGIARVAVEGQPADIGDQIKRLIRFYIKKQETIILVVIPSNVDIATTEALQLAQQFDPAGERSLGVLTKPDLIDKGAEGQVLMAVNNKVIPLKKGYTMVKCRGQAAVDENQRLQEAMNEEQVFFEDHEKFRVLPQDQKGIPSLARKLTNELVEQIKKVVPSLRTEVKEKLETTREELRNLGDGLPITDEGRQAALLEMISKFNSDLLNLSTGDYATKLPKEMRLLTRVRELFGAFGQSIRNLTPREDDRYLMADIKQQIEDHRGRELPKFIMYPVFEALVRDIIKKTEDPGLDCLKGVDRCIDRVLGRVCEKYFARFPKIMGDIKTVLAELRTSAQTTCEEELVKQFAMEGLVYSQDQTFLKEMDAVQEKRDKLREKQRLHYTEIDDREDQPTEEEHVFYSMKAYFDVACRRIIDMVPMIIRHQMLVRLVEKIQRQLLLFGANLENAADVVEDPSVCIKRAELRDKKDRLVRAEMDLNRF